MKRRRARFGFETDDEEEELQQQEEVCLPAEAAAAAEEEEEDDDDEDEDDDDDDDEEEGEAEGHAEGHEEEWLPRPTTERFPGEHALVNRAIELTRADIASKSALVAAGSGRKRFRRTRGSQSPLPPGWTVQVRDTGVSKHKKYRGPGGATARSAAAAWQASAALEARAAALAAASARFPAPAAAASAASAAVPPPASCRRRRNRGSATRRSGGVLVSLPMPSRADELRERRIVRFQTFDNEEQSEAGLSAAPRAGARRAVCRRRSRRTRTSV